MSGSDPAQGSDGRPSVPNVVVVDPKFEAYPMLTASSQSGRIGLHFRSSGADALRLARRLKVDAWLIAAELDDMTGHDLVRMLAPVREAEGEDAARIAIVEAEEPGGRRWLLAEAEAEAAGADSMMSYPISIRDLERLLEYQETPVRRSLTLVDYAMCCVPILVFLSIVTFI